MRHNSRPMRSLTRQSGNTLVIAVFVIVVLGGLVAALSSLLRSTSDSVAVEVLGTRSFMVAQSGIERGMLQLFPLGEKPVTRCPDPAAFVPVQMGKCRAEVTCDAVEYDNNVHFLLTSTGSCQGGEHRTSRQLAVEARVDKE